MKFRFLIKISITALAFSAILFLSAGTIDYTQGWFFLITYVFLALINFWIIRNDTELLIERLTFKNNIKSWDKVILGFIVLFYLISITTAGLDSGRFHWTSHYHWAIYAIGSMLTIVGQMIFLTARKENKYFSTFVRIQTDRGHVVCETGIYRFVRHPGYLGMTLFLLALPLLTGSLWCLIPIIVTVILLLTRTYLEDETLKKELAGYISYSQKTKQRLIPKVW